MAEGNAGGESIVYACPHAELVTWLYAAYTPSLIQYTCSLAGSILEIMLEEYK